MRIPEILLPLCANGIVGERSQILTFWHETLLLIFPAGMPPFTLTYRPREDFMYLVFGMTMGRPRDYVTGDILTTDDYGFWHRHSQMRWHWDPATESIYEFEYPHWLEVTRDDPAEMEFYNNTGRTVIQDFSIWMLECSRNNWVIVQQYLRGIFKEHFDRGKD